MSGIDGMVCAAGFGCGLWIRRRCFEWQHCTEPDASVARAKASGRDHELFFGQRGRYFGPSLFIGSMLGGS